MADNDTSTDDSTDRRDDTGPSTDGTTVPTDGQETADATDGGTDRVDSTPTASIPDPSAFRSPRQSLDGSDEARSLSEDQRPATADLAPATPPITDSVVDESGDVDLSDPALYLNRELSELSFQWRVLNEALDGRNPLLERAKFLAITARNMDEFFMKRVGGLKQQIDAGVTEPTVDGHTPREQWEAVLDRAADLFAAQSRCFHETVEPGLAEAGIELVSYESLDEDSKADLRDYFERSVLPTLTPLTFDPVHPFPFISNLSLSLAVLTRDGDADDEDAGTRFTRVKLPQNRPRLVRVDGEGWSPEDAGPEESRFVLLEELVSGNLDLLFPNVEVVDHCTFRVTRNAEVRRNEEVAEGLIDMIEDVLRQRRFATVVRLEIAADAPEQIRSLLVDQLDLTEKEVFDLPEPLAFEDFSSLLSLDRPDLKLPTWTPKPHPRFDGLSPATPNDLFAEIARDDILVHHPYHSFSTTVQTFLDAAAHDPNVLAIKAAIYRTAPDSTVIRSLIEAAKKGKQVAVMVELKARFDEENNLRWVKRLEEEGIHVAYGTIGLKTHSKVALAVREEDDGVELYSHVATGNYHSETAKSYADLGLFTNDSDVGQDLVRLFNSFTGHSRNESYRKLLVAPENLRTRLTDHIRREAEFARRGEEARIVAKMNSLEDPAIAEELYRAARAGVEIDLIVRGICRVRPGIEGVSDSIRVHSVVGRFLEHSRILYFRNGGDSAYYIGSADWMVRNLDRRVEAVTPVEDPRIRSELRAVLEVMLLDNRRRWTMNADGSYVQCVPEGTTVDTHETLMRRAEQTAPEDAPPEGDDRIRDAHETSIDLDDVFTDDTDVEYN